MEIEDSGWPILPDSNSTEYFKQADLCISQFVHDNLIVKKIKAKEFSLKDYHALLINIFHQVFHSSTSFALAGSMLGSTSVSARGYLLAHAEEEKDHWKWILNDLEKTGYTGLDPRKIYPSPSTQAYFAYAIYLGIFKPLGRLAMAHVLEGISGQFGGEYGKQVMFLLGLKKDQATFFLNHGELDIGHTHDIKNILMKENLQPSQWAELKEIVKTTEIFYKAIYNSVGAP